MHSAIDLLLEKYACQTEAEYVNALHEIMQQIALLGLWRAKFFEHAAFYGGTALRILYGLNRFSEDLDFSLLQSNESFDLSAYNAAIARELNSFGFETEVTQKPKKTSAIQSAFIKANTKRQFILIEAPKSLVHAIHKDQVIKIKMEIDTNPPSDFHTEAKVVLTPTPFSVNSYTRPSLFAGKLHAILCRSWKNRVKGRDWYDLLWYLSHGIKPDLLHLQKRLEQSGHWQTKDGDLTQDKLKELLLARIEQIDFALAKADVAPFIQEKASLQLWSQEFFQSVLDQL